MALTIGAFQFIPFFDHLKLKRKLKIEIALASIAPSKVEVLINLFKIFLKFNPLG